MQLLAFLLVISVSLTAQEYKLEGNEVKIDKPVLFETASDKLKEESTAALEVIKKYLTDKSYISLLRVECHTDNTNDESTNQALSEKRAGSVRDYLISKGVDASRLKATGYGETKPVADNNTAAGRAKNRRTEMTVRNY